MKKTPFAKNIIISFIIVILSLSIFSVTAFALNPGYSVSVSYSNTEYYNNLLDVVLTGDECSDIINIALSQVGYTSDSFSEYSRWYTREILSLYRPVDMHWSAAFIFWCASCAEIPSETLPYLSSVTELKNAVLVKDSAEIGDIAFINTSSDNSEQRVSLVFDCIDGFIFTVGGEINDSVAISVYPENDPAIEGFYSPNYHVISSEHNFSEWEVSKHTSCTESGEKTRICSDCGFVETKPILPTEHSFGNFVIDIPSTCSSLGEISRHCKRCDARINISSIPFSEHTFSEEWTVDKESTCCEHGERSHHCTNCGERADIEQLPLAEHEFLEDWTVDRKATCTLNGEISRHCINCDARTDIVLTPATGHAFSDDWIIDAEATCTEDGSKHRICTVCGEERETEIIPASGHEISEEWFIDLAPTCMESGEKSHHCSVCGERLDITEIEPLKHDYECVFHDPATCDTPGKNIYVCKNDNTHTYEEYIPMLEHLESEWIIDSEPTYEHDGTRHKECVHCGITLRRETVSMLSDIIVPYGKIILANSSWTKYSDKIAATHYKNQKVAITIEGFDDETGVKKIEYFISDNIIPYSELAMLSWIRGTNLLLENEGEFIIYAKITDNADNICYISSDLIVVDMSIPQIEGLRDSEIYCLKATFMVNDSNLLYVKINGTVAEPDNKGKYTISARNGFQSIEACDFSNNIIFITVMVNAEHEFKNLITDVIPTCFDGGAGHYECIHCGAVQYEMLDPYGHEAPKDWEIKLHPTCETEGSAEKHCIRCSTLLESEVLPKLSHEYKNGKCTRCGNVYSKDIPPVAIVIGSIFAVLAILVVVFDRTKKTNNARIINAVIGKTTGKNVNRTKKIRK